MTTTINAKSTGIGGLDVTGDASGSLGLQTGGVTAVTIDASQNVAFAKGFTVGATAAPAFSATASGNQTISTGTATKVVYDSEDFDTNSNFSSNRFTPTVAGYYQLNYNIVASNAAASSETWIAIYKNGSNWQWGLDTNSITNHYWTLNASSLVYLNGSTDYVEVYMSQSTGSNLTINPSSSLPMRFSGFLARSA